MKLCSKCKLNRHTSEFYSDKRSKDGLYSSCKTCFANVKQLWRTKNTETIALKSKGYRLKNKEKRAKYNKLWADKNPEKNYLIFKRSREKHADRIVAWKKSEKGKFLICYYAQKRRRLLQGSFSFKEWEELLKNCKYICGMCNKKFTNENPATIDHIIPVSKGGLNVIENIQPLHGVCNSRKGQKIINFNLKKI